MSQKKERIVVGVNEYLVEDEAPIEVATIDPALERDQVDRVAALRRRRPAAEHARALSVLGDAARGTDELVGPILAAVKAQATVGEVADVLRAVFGEHTPSRTV